MKKNKTKNQSDTWPWQQALIDDYYDYYCHKVMEPLCETFRRWKAGELTHKDIDRAIEKAYHERCAMQNLFDQRPDRCVALISVLDPKWFNDWIKKHRPRKQK
ncbi:MAG: hypothetical protein ABIL20_07575 [candidate division WOR-3 bacterium]